MNSSRFCFASINQLPNSYRTQITLILHDLLRWNPNFIMQNQRYLRSIITITSF